MVEIHAPQQFVEAVFLGPFEVMTFNPPDAFVFCPASTHGDDWLRIVGTEGSIEAAMERGVLTIINADGVQEITQFAAREPYYPPILRAMPKPGQSGPTADTCQSFALTHAALCARDAADECRTITDLSGPWDE